VRTLVQLLPSAEIGTAQQEIPVFKTMAHRGFQTTFPNGYTVSVMFGAGSYCQQRHNKDILPDPWASTIKWGEMHQSVDAEIQVFGPDDWVVCGWPGCPDLDMDPDVDLVRGCITPEQMLEVMNWAASQS